MMSLNIQRTHEDSARCSSPTQKEIKTEDNGNFTHGQLDKLAPQNETGGAGLHLVANSQENDALLAPRITVRDSGKKIPNAPKSGYSELLDESKVFVCQAMLGRESFALALERLSYFISLYPRSTDAHAMRAIVKRKLGDIEGAILDCDTILRIHPNNSFALLHRTSFLEYDRVDADNRISCRKVVQGVLHARKMISDRYATLIKYSVTPLILPTEDDFSEVSGHAQARADDRCAQAVLTAMRFSHWLWSGEKNSKNQAINHAVKMQRSWPNDKLAMSVLWCLEGHLGGGSLTESSPRGVNYGSRDDLYPKECITAHILFDYPIEQQDTGLMTSIETTQFS